MYRLIGEVSAYFLDGQKIRMGDHPPAMNALTELEYCVDGWTRLTWKTGLGRLEVVAAIWDGSHFSTSAERFKVFLTEFKCSRDWESWDYFRMRTVREVIFKVVNEIAVEEHTPLVLPPGKKTPCSGDSCCH